jgi:hypothetical protein
MRPGVVGPAAIFVGVLPASAKVSQEGSNYIVGTFITRAEEVRNTAKILVRSGENGAKEGFGGRSEGDTKQLVAGARRIPFTRR